MTRANRILEMPMTVDMFSARLADDSKKTVVITADEQFCDRKRRVEFSKKEIVRISKWFASVAKEMK